MDKFIDLDWLSEQVGLPVSFLIGIPVFLVIVLTLASMTANRGSHNYKSLSGNGSGNIGGWLASIFFLAVIGFLVFNVHE